MLSPAGFVVFDAANRTAVKMIAKTWLKTAKIKDVGRILQFRMRKMSFPRGTAVCRYPAGAICWVTAT